jgi:hypothetical protein
MSGTPRRSRIFRKSSGTTSLYSSHLDTLGAIVQECCSNSKWNYSGSPRTIPESSAASSRLSNSGKTSRSFGRPAARLARMRLGKSSVHTSRPNAGSRTQHFRISLQSPRPETSAKRSIRPRSVSRVKTVPLFSVRSSQMNGSPGGKPASRGWLGSQRPRQPLQIDAGA